MKFQVIDKAKWHYGAANAPKDIPLENGATHIAFFLRWCVEHDFMSKEMITEFGAEFPGIKSGKTDCRQFFVDTMDGVLTTEELNTAGGLFASAYYSSEKTKFAKLHGYYLSDYNDIIAAHFKESNHDNAYFYFEYSEANYQTVKTVIERRYQEFLTMGAKKAK